MNDNGPLNSKPPKAVCIKSLRPSNAFVIDENGQLHFSSQTLATRLGYRAEELLAKDAIELLFAPQSRPQARRIDCQRFVQCL